MLCTRQQCPALVNPIVRHYTNVFLQMIQCLQVLMVHPPAWIPIIPRGLTGLLSPGGDIYSH